MSADPADYYDLSACPVCNDRVCFMDRRFIIKECVMICTECFLKKFNPGKDINMDPIE